MKFSDLNIPEVPLIRVDMTEEWGEGVVIYGKPLTPADLSWVTRKHKNFMSGANSEGIIDLLIRKAMNEDGEKFFTLEDKVKLKNMPLEIVSKACEVYGELQAPDEAEAEKN